MIQQLLFFLKKDALIVRPAVYAIVCAHNLVRFIPGCHPFKGFGNTF